MCLLPIHIVYMYTGFLNSGGDASCAACTSGGATACTSSMQGQQAGGEGGGRQREGHLRGVPRGLQLCRRLLLLGQPQACSLSSPAAAVGSSACLHGLDVRLPASTLLLDFVSPLVLVSAACSSDRGTSAGSATQWQHEVPPAWQRQGPEVGARPDLRHVH